MPSDLEVIREDITTIKTVLLGVPDTDSRGLVGDVKSALVILQAQSVTLQQHSDMTAKLSQNCPSLGGSGACHNHRAEGRYWLKWLIWISAIIGTGVGSAFGIRMWI